MSKAKIDAKSRKELAINYYPSPVSRKAPEWLFFLQFGFDATEEQIGDLLGEVYGAVDGGQHRLAAMGIRAALEQVMIACVGDLATFEQKLDAFQATGFVSAIQREALKATLEIGHAAMHRGFAPNEKELKIALDILEGVLAPIYGHKSEAEKLAVRVPPRQR